MVVLVAPVLQRTGAEDDVVLGSDRLQVTELYEFFVNERSADRRCELPILLLSAVAVVRVGNRTDRGSPVH